MRSYSSTFTQKKATLTFYSKACTGSVDFWIEKEEVWKDIQMNVLETEYFCYLKSFSENLKYYAMCVTRKANLERDESVTDSFSK